MRQCKVTCIVHEESKRSFGGTLAAVVRMCVNLARVLAEALI